MGLPRVRFTARWLMAAVAVVALVMGAELTRRRWAHRQQMARHYARAERTYRDQAKEIADEIDRGRSDLDLALERRLWRLTVPPSFDASGREALPARGSPNHPSHRDCPIRLHRLTSLVDRPIGLTVTALDRSSFVTSGL